MVKRLVLFLFTIILISSALPAFGEVTQFQLNKESYSKDEYINLHGTVSEDSSGLVSIVIRDPNNNFVLLSQATIRGDNSFEKSIPITEDFEILGRYNATAFVQNITEAKIQPFYLTENIDQKENPSVIYDNGFFDADQEGNEKTLEPVLTHDTSTKSEFIQKTKIDNSEIADFVDQNKDPQHYIDRYNNEPNYKSWFDRNYPGLSIEKAVGYNMSITRETEKPGDIIKTEILPKVEAFSIVSGSNNQNNNSSLAHMGLAIGGLVILFGAVYGIKKKVDSDSRNFSINKDKIKRILSPIIDSNPIEIIQTRLAKGEITIDEYDKLKERLENSN